MMLGVNLEDIDELYSISLELGMLTYLQNLVRYDAVNDVLEDEDRFQSVCKYAQSYLLDNTMETVLMLKNLLEKEGFACNLKDERGVESI